MSLTRDARLTSTRFAYESDAPRRSDGAKPTGPWSRAHYDSLLGPFVGRVRFSASISPFFQPPSRSPSQYGPSVDLSTRSYLFFSSFRLFFVG